LRRSSSRTYVRVRPLRAVLTALVCILAAAVILFTGLFIGLRRHIVYTDDGELRLDIPWLAEYMHSDVQSGSGTT
jgi:hypothetical protein